MDCSEAKPHLSALASGRASADHEAEVRGHLETCEVCALELEFLQRTTGPPPAASETGPEAATPPIAPPIAPLPPPNSDWTVEKIFDGNAPPSGAPAAAGEGTAVESFVAESLAAELAAESAAAEASAGASAPNAPPASPLASESPTAESLADDTSTASSSMPMTEETTEIAEAPPGSRATPTPEAWDFEPADAAREATPPEESLLFAEQALSRRPGDSNRKRAAMRAILWVGSAVLGVGLLGVSLWMAMAVREAPPLEISARVKNSGARADELAAPAPTASPESLDAPEAHDPALEPTAIAPTPGTIPTPAPPASVDATSNTPIKSGLAPDAAPPAPANAPLAAKRAASRTSAPAPNAAPVKAGATSVAAKEPRPTEKPAAPAGVAPTIRVKRDDDDMWPTDDPIHAAPAVPKGGATPKRAAGSSAPAATAPEQGLAAAPASGEPVSTPAPAPRSGETAAPGAPEAPRADLKPIDRLHLDTVQAAKDQNLVALRKLKATWKSLVRTVIGPDRTRAKREFADCLWEIQALSGRDADQRETLQAYREYLLNAPAGGADPRSAARLHELEDAFSERH